MRSNGIRLVAVVIALPLVTACSLDASDDAGAPDLMGDGLLPAPTETQGVSMQGISMQGISMQGISMQGVSMQGVSMQGISLGGVRLDDVSLVGTILVGKRHGARVSGADFVGATMSARLSTGLPVPLRIDAIEATADPDLYRYVLSYYASGWKPLCGPDRNGSPIRAIPLAGAWDESSGTRTGGSYIDDPSMITFSCRTGVLSKCVDLGYKPWQSVEECSGSRCRLASLRPYHQACTRMMRADYCGDGAPHTVNGTHINLWDNLAIQEPDASVKWPLEAEWTTEGAQCVKHVRWTIEGAPQATDSELYVDAHCPEVRSEKALESCGSAASSFWDGASSATPIEERVLLRDASVAPPKMP